MKDEYSKAIQRLSDEALKEQDNEHVEKIRGQLRGNRLGADHWVDSDMWRLLAIIERLEVEITSLKRYIDDKIDIGV